MRVNLRLLSLQEVGRPRKVASVEGWAAGSFWTEVLKLVADIERELQKVVLVRAWTRVREEREVLRVPTKSSERRKTRLLRFAIVGTK